MLRGAHYLPSLVELPTLFQVELHVEHSDLSLPWGVNMRLDESKLKDSFDKIRFDAGRQ